MTDWHREDIKAEVRKAGATLAEIGRRAGLSRPAMSLALIRPSARAERAIAKVIGVAPSVIWPSRYHDSGRRRSPQPPANYLDVPARGGRGASR